MSLQYHVIRNYIQNTASDQELQSLNNIIKEEHNIRQHKRLLDKLLPEDNKLKNKILNIEHNFIKEYNETWEINFVDGGNLKFDIIYNIEIIKLEVCIYDDNIAEYIVREVSECDDEGYNCTYACCDIILDRNKISELLYDDGLLDIFLVFIRSYINHKTIKSISYSS